MNEKGHSSKTYDNDPKWLHRFRRSRVAAVAALAGVVLATSLDLTDKVINILEKLGLMTNVPMSLARETERSRFSDAFVRAAHRRLMLGEIFARRVQDRASEEQITDAWKSYVAALIDWNADLMINIVGLEQYYTAEKSREFEGIVQPKFIEFDSAVRLVYLNRIGKADLVETPDRPPRTVFQIATDIRETLYVFVRCIRQGQEANKRTDCNLNDFVVDQTERTFLPRSGQNGSNANN